MGWRFKRVLNLFPFLRLNLSKSGLSTSVGPRGADVNIGRHGMTTNAGIPGTGLSYRQKMGGKGTLTGILMVVAGLGFALYKHNWDVGALITGKRASTTHAERTIAPRGQSATAAPRAPRVAAGADVVAAAIAATGTLYISRNNSDLRSAPSYSATVLKRMVKGSTVTLLATSDDWRMVQDGATQGWMRAGTLRDTPPGTKKPKTAP
jgi:hypothetical protein